MFCAWRIGINIAFAHYRQGLRSATTTMGLKLTCGTGMCTSAVDDKVQTVCAPI